MKTSDHKTNVAILECGESVPGSLEAHGDYNEMCAVMLGLTVEGTTTYRVMDGEIPTHTDQHQIYVITGSKFGAYEDHDWIPPLEDFIRRAQSAGHKMIGVCFGHQIIAQALGGRVEKSDKGFGIGVMSYQVQGVDPLPSNLALYAWHQDQVVAAPDGAEIIASSDFCPIAGLKYGDQMITFQPHPEFTAGYEQVLIDARRGTVISEDLANKGEASLTAPTNSADICAYLRSFAGLDHLR